MQYIKEIDGLRGIAASGIVIFHLFPSYTFWMWSFVDLFFVLSGYLVTGILLQDRKKGSLSLKKFWMRRVLRIWPVYFITLFFVVILLMIQRGWFEGLENYEQHVRLSSVFLQFTPYYFIGDANPWQPFDFLPGFFHSWTLAIEEQFYFFWPVFIMIALRFINARWVIGVCLLMLGFCLFSRFWLAWHPYMLLSRMDGLILGSALAILIFQLGVSIKQLVLKQLFYGCLFVGLISSLPYLYEGYWKQVGVDGFFSRPLIITSFCLIYFGLFGLILGEAGGKRVEILRNPILVYLGSISYAMYMYHFPILFYIKPQFEKYLPIAINWMSVPLTLSLILICCYISRNFVEKPVLSLKKHFY